MEMKGKVVVVTGGAQGIGEAIAMCFAREGAYVVVCDINVEKVREVSHNIMAMGLKSLWFEVDVTCIYQINTMAEKTAKRFGHIDYLVNNAGISPQMVPTIEQDIDTWQKIVDTNLKGTYLCSKRIGREMINYNSGRIVNISSIVGLTGFPMRTEYGPAKSAIINLTKALAIEWAPFNINVNAIAPGYIRTEMVESIIHTGKLNEEMLCNRIPLRRLGTKEEIANVVRFLCSESASYITGTTIVVDGGWVAHGSI